VRLYACDSLPVGWEEYPASNKKLSVGMLVMVVVQVDL